MQFRLSGMHARCCAVILLACLLGCTWALGPAVATTHVSVTLLESIMGGFCVWHCVCPTDNVQQMPCAVGAQQWVPSLPGDGRWFFDDTGNTTGSAGAPLYCVCTTDVCGTCHHDAQWVSSNGFPACKPIGGWTNRWVVEDGFLARQSVAPFIFLAACHLAMHAL